MALYFFVLVTLLKFALCLPDPNVKVGIDLRVDDKGGCEGGGCNKKSCLFGEKVWPSGCILTEACFKLKCEDGTWKYTPGDIDSKCGECKVVGDPHIYPFDEFLTPNGTYYTKYFLDNGGEYIIAQPGFDYPAVFGVKGNFTDCDWLNFTGGQPMEGSCIVDITYYEIDISIKMIPPLATDAKKCVNGVIPAGDPRCDIKVLVDGINIIVGSSVEVFSGALGEILVFKHVWTGGNNLNCISIIGTKGFSVTLCEYWEKYPYLYIRAMPSLASLPFKPLKSTSALYGLCNTYTTDGHTTTFVLKNETTVKSEDCLTPTNIPWERYEICNEFSNSWELS